MLNHSMKPTASNQGGPSVPYRRSEAAAVTRGTRNALFNAMLLGEAQPFPADMEVTLRRLHAHDPSLVDNIDHRYFVSWQAGQGLAEGRALLGAIAAYVATKTAPEPIPSPAASPRKDTRTP
jgi:hypothetical protein